MAVLSTISLLVMTIYFAQVYTAYILFKRKGLIINTSFYFTFPIFSFKSHVTMSVNALKSKKFSFAGMILIYSMTRYDISVSIFSSMMIEHIAQYEAYGINKYISQTSEPEVEKPIMSRESVTELLKQLRSTDFFKNNLREIY